MASIHPGTVKVSTGGNDGGPVRGPGGKGKARIGRGPVTEISDGRTAPNLRGPGISKAMHAPVIRLTSEA
jgi:hypothetical protein